MLLFTISLLTIPAKLETFKYFPPSLVVEMAEVTVTVPIPEDLKKELASVSELHVSLAIARLVKDELARISRTMRIVAKSRLSQKKADEISHDINESLAKRYESL